MHNKILLNHKKEWNFAICNNMDGPGGSYEINLTVEDKYSVCVCACACVRVRVRAHAHVLSHSVVSDSLWPPWTIGCQAPLFMEFSRQEYWSLLPFPTPGYLPNAGIKPSSLACSALAGRLFTTALPRKPNTIYYHLHVKSKKMKQMNEYNKTEQTYRYREQTSGYQWEERAR